MKRLGLIGLVLAVVFLGSFGVAMAAGILTPEAVQQSLDRLNESPNARLLIALAVVGLLVGDIVLPVPATVLMVVAGNVLGSWLGGAACAIGMMGATAVGYYACHFGGRTVLAKLVSEAEADRAGAWFDRYGVLAIVMTRGLPVLPEVIACLAGLAHIRAGRFFLAAAIGTLPFAFLHTFAGQYSSWSNPTPALLVLVGLPALVWTVWRVIERRRGRA